MPLQGEKSLKLLLIIEPPHTLTLKQNLFIMFTQINDAELKPAAIAKKAGFIIPAVDINQAQSVISEEELERVAGGFLPTDWFLFPYNYKSN